MADTINMMMLMAVTIYMAHINGQSPFIWPVLMVHSQFKSRFTPRTTRKPNTQNSSKRNGNEWACVANIAHRAAAVWAKRTFEVADNAAQNARTVLRAHFILLHWNVNLRRPC